MVDDRHRLLLVEDDALLSEITAFRLELLGFAVETVNAGRQAFEAIERQMPHAVILDVAIPDVNGYDLIERLTSEPATSGVPILVFSTDPDPHAVQRAIAAGATDYLITPYDPAVLEKKLELLLDQAETAC